MKEKIIQLRNKGFSYNEIVSVLGCAKSTVAYHCGEGQKEKSKERIKRFRCGESKSRTITNRKCSNCNIITKNKKFCSNKCQQEFKYKKYIDKWLAGKETGTRSNGFTVRNYVRRIPVLEVEHLDGNSSNNRPENLDLICPNCHSLTTTYKALNKGNGNQKRLKYNKLK